MLDYYTLQRTLEMLKESPNDEYTAQDLAILCRQGILTPVFAYNRYCMEILEYYYDSGKPEQPSIGRSPEPMTKHFHDGYLTDKHLLSLLDKSMDKLKLFSAMTYKSDGSGWEIELVTNDGYTVTRESLLFPSEQVQSYIASRQTNEQNTPEQQRIADLENQLAQVKAQLADKPADDKELPSNSQAGVARMLYAILTEHGYDLSPMKGKGVANDMIVSAANTHGTSVTRNFVADWLIRAREVNIKNT